MRISSNRMGTGTHVLPDSGLWTFWAKWSTGLAGTGTWHPLLCHMLDVAVTAQALWPRTLSALQRARIADALGMSEPAAAVWIAFFAGLHDLGKASPAFQAQLKSPLVEGWLRAANLSFNGATWAPHGTISAITLEDVLPGKFGIAEPLTRQIAAAVGGHHGIFPHAIDLQNLTYEQLGDEVWNDQRAALAWTLAHLLELPACSPSGPLFNADAMALAGFVSVADWVGSNEHYFRHLCQQIEVPEPLALDVCLRLSQERAAAALQDLNWDTGDVSKHPLAFTHLFPGKAPRAAQAQAIDLAARLRGPALVILEVPMGEGKTEAAMYLADFWNATLGQHGAYFALPTQATSNQMFDRVRDFLEQRYHDEAFVNLHLAHGAAALSEQYGELRARARRLIALKDVYDDVQQNHAPGQGAVIAAEWFATPKRTLLSPFGVGTIDQMLLGVLHVKHGFVRLFGLGGKTVIVDEVHAYDTYMSTLLGRLLQWLGALGTPTVLLSATLPRVKRHELMECYATGAGWTVTLDAEQPYPRLAWVSVDGAGSGHVATSTVSRFLALRWVDGELPEGDSAFHLGEQLAEILRDGGCAAVICNTVNRAQQVYRALQRHFPGVASDGLPELDLLHARFLHADRQQREQRVLRRFGRGKHVMRPHRAVLVATQVIEQSLDLDFDLMVSDLAPVDLLLQRSGRLHRHAEHDAQRPDAVKAPTLWIRRPEIGEGGVPAFDRGDEAVYASHVLLRSWHTLQGRAAIRIPEDVEELIEAIYDDRRICPPDTSEAFRTYWIETQARAHTEADNSEAKALLYRILPPWADDLFEAFGPMLKDDNPGANVTVQALTRDSEPNAQVVVLDAEPAARFNSSAEPAFDEVRVLLDRSVSLTHRGLVPRLLEEEPPAGWMRSPWLRHHRLIALNTSGQATYGGHYTLTLDPDLGIVITDTTCEKEVPRATLQPRT